MTDLEAQIRAVNPIGVNDLTEDDLPSFDVVWLAAERAPITPNRGPRMRFVRSALTTRRGWIALASTTGTGAAVVAALVLSAGTAPTPAQAFPILNKRGIDIASNASVRRALARWLPSASALFGALHSAHSFPIPAGSGDTGVGYLLQSPDGVSLCLLLRELGAAGQPGSLVHSAFGPVVCSSTADAERSGLVAVGGAAAYQTDGNVFVALIPAGATVHVSDNGATTPVPVSDGIATGVAPPTGTLTTNVAGVARTAQLTASAEPWWPPAPSSASGATSTSGSTAGSGAGASPSLASRRSRRAAGALGSCRSHRGTAGHKRCSSFVEQVYGSDGRR